jgi:hypothetical protein
MTLIRIFKPAIAVTAALAFLSGAAAARADQTIATTARPTKGAAGQGVIA